MLKIKNVKCPTIMGCGAIFLWAIEPLLVSELENFPLFGSLTIIFASSFIITALRVTYNKRWGLIRSQPSFIWVVGIIGICGSDFAYILAAECAPIAHVDLIDYLWPCFVVIFISFLPKEKFSIHHTVGALLGLLGIGVLAIDNIFITGDLDLTYILGGLLALFGAMLWGLYSAFSRHNNSIPTEMVGMYCGPAALICLLFHVCLEEIQIPEVSQLSLMVTIGVTAAGVAYQLWDHGIKFGNVRLLSSITYFARVIAMVLLVSFGKEPLTIKLVIAVILSSLGVFVCSLEEKFVKRMLSKLSPKFSSPSLRDEQWLEIEKVEMVMPNKNVR